MQFRSLLILLFLFIPYTTLAEADNRAIKRNSIAIESRTALVIGNGAYTDAPLANPVHDAEDMAAALKNSGFKVDLRLNIKRREMKNAIQDLGDNLRYGGVGLFYFAGHGIQVDGINYLLPVDANIRTEADVPYEAVNANRALTQMQKADNRLNMVFLDACRNNPYARSFRSASRGLAAMDAPRGSLVSFATAPGYVAADGEGRNGVYTKHLLRQMIKKNLELSRMMKKVRLGVQTDTGDKQTPFELSSLIGDFYFNGGSPVQVQVADNKKTAVSGTTGDAVMWQAVKDSTAPYELRLFLAEYPDSRYRGLAKLRIARLEREKVEAEPRPEPETESLPVLALVEPEPTPEAGRLFVSTTPANARIRILNIKPRYQRGIQLSPGSYHIEVQKSGYTTNKQWIVLIAGDELKVGVTLEKIVQPEPVVVTAPVPSTVNKLRKIRSKDRFVVANGTVKDSVTGLMWAAKDSPFDIDWNDARRYCKAYTGGGFTDWRMPTWDELSKLYAAGIRKRNASPKVIIDISLYVWAIETHNSSAAVLVFTDGVQLWNVRTSSAYSRALPVRGGN